MVLPVTKQDLQEQGIRQPDFVYVIGDAYVDHPSFGPAIISRLLEAPGVFGGHAAAAGLERDRRAYRFSGEPRLAFLVSSGNMDSMVNHYTVSEEKTETLLFARGDGPAAGPGLYCIQQSDPASLQTYACDSGRD